MIRAYARSCEEVENLLVRQCNTTCPSENLAPQDNKTLSNEEVATIHEHVNTCVSCNTFLSTLTAIHQTVSKDLLDIFPDPDIPQRIKDRVVTKPLDADRVTKVPEGRSTRHIPIYQVILGLAAVLALTFVGLNASNSIDHERADRSTGVVFADTSSFLSQDSLQRNRTIQEDSLPIQNFRGTYDTLRTDGKLKRL